MTNAAADHWKANHDSQLDRKRVVERFRDAFKDQRNVATGALQAAVAWLDAGGEPSVAVHQMRRALDEIGASIELLSHALPKPGENYVEVNGGQRWTVEQVNSEGSVSLVYGGGTGCIRIAHASLVKGFRKVTLPDGAPKGCAKS